MIHVGEIAVGIDNGNEQTAHEKGKGGKVGYATKRTSSIKTTSAYTLIPLNKTVGQSDKESSMPNAHPAQLNNEQYLLDELHYTRF